MKNKLIQQIEDAQKAEAAASRLKAIEKSLANKKGAKAKETLIPNFEIGDNIDIHQRILEGDKERLQIFSGTVIARRGSGMQETFTVRRVVQGEGVERIFPLASPRIAMIEIKRSGKVRRAKLYFLRDRVGKATKLKERKAKKVAPKTAATPPAAPMA